MVTQNNTTPTTADDNDSGSETVDMQGQALASWRQRWQPGGKMWNGLNGRDKSAKDDDSSKQESVENLQVHDERVVRLDSESQAASNDEDIDEESLAVQRHTVGLSARHKNANLQDDSQFSQGEIVENLHPDEIATFESKTDSEDTRAEESLVQSPKSQKKKDSSDELNTTASLSDTSDKVDHRKATRPPIRIKPTKEPSTNEAIPRQASVQFNSLNGLEHILFIKLNDPNQKDVEQAVLELAHLTGDDHDGNVEENCEKIYRLGGYGVLMATMTRFPHSPTVQGTCISVFSNIVFHSVICRDALVATSALYLVTQTMQRFPKDGHVQGMSLQFLWSFMDAEGQKNKFVGDLKGVPLVTAAMTAFINDVEFQMSGCQVLCKLSTTKDIEIQKHLKTETNAVICVATALRTYPGVCEELADDFMTKVFEDPAKHRKRFKPKRVSIAWKKGLKGKAIADKKAEKAPVRRTSNDYEEDSDSAGLSMPMQSSW